MHFWPLTTFTPTQNDAHVESLLCLKHGTSQCMRVRDNYAIPQGPRKILATAFQASFGEEGKNVHRQGTLISSLVYDFPYDRDHYKGDSSSSVRKPQRRELGDLSSTWRSVVVTVALTQLYLGYL